MGRWSRLENSDFEFPLMNDIFEGGSNNVQKPESTPEIPRRHL